MRIIDTWEHGSERAAADDNTVSSDENDSKRKRVRLRRGNGISASFNVKGCGRFGIYCSAKPLSITVNARDVKFSYDSSLGIAEFELTAPAFIQQTKQNRRSAVEQEVFLKW